MGTIIFVVLLAVEAICLGWAVRSRRNMQAKNIARIAAFAALAVLLVTGVFAWGFRYYLVLGVLAAQAVIGAVALFRKIDKPYRLRGSIIRAVGGVVLYAGALLPAKVFPQHRLPVTAGGYEVATASYTWVDENRIETFSDSGENRALTVEFWYPQDAAGTFPLVVFSHGAFGIAASNESTFVELASHGYVVASIAHTYHAFFTRDTSGKITLANRGFLSDALAINSLNDPEKEYYGTRDWIALRVADGHFILDTITALANAPDSGTPFSAIDLGCVGVFGHSLGGAMAAQLGRERGDIGAVINLDGSMLGEAIGFENGKAVLNDVPYPVPLLNVYTEELYKLAMAETEDEFVNFRASRNATVAHEVILKDAGHLNVTDLPLFSPVLARMLGTGSVDARYCVETTNGIVRGFFDAYLKSGITPVFEKEY